MANLKIGGLAKAFIGLWKREQEAKKLRKGAAEKLQEHLHRHHLEEFTVDGDKVVMEVTSKKCPTKMDLVLAFGEEAAEKFWTALKPSTSVYLTVKPAKTQVEGKKAS
jgi:hypothetical protein